MPTKTLTTPRPSEQPTYIPRTWDKPPVNAHQAVHYLYDLMQHLSHSSLKLLQLELTDRGFDAPPNDPLECVVLIYDLERAELSALLAPPDAKDDPDAQLQHEEDMPF